MRALNSVCSGADEWAGACERAAVAGAIEAVVGAMSAHADAAGVQEQGCPRCGACAPPAAATARARARRARGGGGRAARGRRGDAAAPEASGVQDAASLAYAVLGAASGGGGGGDGGDAAAQRQMAMMQRKRAILRLFARTEMRAALQMQRALARAAPPVRRHRRRPDAGDLAPETCRRRRHRQRCRRRRDRRRRDRRRRARRRRTRRRRRQNCEIRAEEEARAARASAEAAERRARQLQAAAAMKASDPEVRAALAMQTLWRALCARRALTRARRRAASDQMAWQRQLIASVERERQEEEAARFVQDAYRAAVRRKRLNLVRKRAAEHAEQKRKQELAERQQAFETRGEAKAEAATSFDPAAAEKVTAERRRARSATASSRPSRRASRGAASAPSSAPCSASGARASRVACCRSTACRPAGLSRWRSTGR